MQRIPSSLLAEMESLLTPEERAEMALPSYRHPNPLLRWMAWYRVNFLARWVDWWARRSPRPVGDREIMDYGCGCGVLLVTAARNAGKVYGVDIVLSAAQLLVERQQLDRVELLEPEAAQSVIKPGSLDLIICGEVLEHVPSLKNTLAFFRSAIRPEGRLLISVPTENMAYRIGRKLAGFDGHYHHLNARLIHAEILKNGFHLSRLVKIPMSGPLAIYWCAEYGRIKQPDARRLP